MPKDRFFFEQPLVKDTTIKLEGEEFHHLVNVMRIKINEEIEIVNGQGQLAIASVQSIQKKLASLLVREVIFQEATPFSIILAQSLPRPNRLDFILEKATELGVTEIWLFPGQTSERKLLSENQLERCHTITVSAMKQSGRLYLPKILIKESLEHLSFTLPAFFGDVEPNAPLFLDVWHKKPADKGLIFFIGPEAGFTDTEITALKTKGALGVKLNPNILRTDTAAITALALMNHCIS